MKQPSIKYLKKRLDVVFSVFIRKRGMDSQGYVKCVSCGAIALWTGDGMQCGHFYKRQHLATRWDERNCHVQCQQCNVFKQGNYPAFARYMYRTFPQSVMDNLDALHKQPVKLTREYLQNLIDKYS